MLFAEAFGEIEVPPDHIRKGNCRRYVYRHLDTEQRCEAANCWTNNETYPRCRAKQAKVFATLLWLADVPDIGKKYAHIAACKSVDYSAEKKNPQRSPKTEQHITGC